MAKETTGIYDTKALARFFRVTEETICEWCKDGKLPAFKIGQRWRVRVADLQKIIDGKVKSRKSNREAGLF
jgi:excisionase family DNA binding protein